MSETSTHDSTTLNASMIQRYPGEAAHLIEQLEPADAATALLQHGADIYGALFDHLSLSTAQTLFDSLGEDDAVVVLNQLHPRRAAELVGAEPPARRKALLERIDCELHEHIELLLRYPNGTAGALMDPRILRLYESMTVEQALNRLREQRTSLRPVRARRILYIVDDLDRPCGMIEIQDLALAASAEVLSRFMQPLATWAEAHEERESLVEKLEEHQISSLPVVASTGELLGLVRYETLVAVAREDAVADIQTLFGVDREERALSPVRLSVGQRLPWLQVNLLTAFLAAAVVGLFESTIASYTALAVLLPVVAGQSGNTGAQALAVVIRSLALREVRTSQWQHVLRKEFGVGPGERPGRGCFGGPSCLPVVGIARAHRDHHAGHGAVGAHGRPGRRGDPVDSCAPGPRSGALILYLLTTVTDIAGFFSFLGIATILLGL